jgi:chemotaxis protein CheX
MISQHDFEALVVSVWSEMPGLPLAAAVPTARPAAGERLAASIAFHGATEGQIVLVTTPALARLATSHLLSQPLAVCTGDELEDVVCELCNIIGGGVKSLLPGPNRLSLPAVVPDGRPVEPDLPGSAAIHVRFDCEGQPLDVWLWAAEAGTRWQSRETLCCAAAAAQQHD